MPADADQAAPAPSRDTTTSVPIGASAALAPLVDPTTPAAPAQPTVWAMLGLFARESGRTWFNRRPDVPGQQVDVTLDSPDDVGDPIALGATDPDGDALTYHTPRIKVFGGARHGTVTIDQTTGTFTYDPDDAFALTGGRDRFLVRVSDYGNGFHVHGLNIFGGHSEYARVTVNVLPANRVPVAGNDTVTATEDTLVTINPKDLLANDTDAEGDALTVDGVDQPGHGTVWFNRDGSLSYVPDENFNGTDTFAYTVTDGKASASATVTVTVDAVNDAPLANDDTVTATEDTLLTIDPKDLLANDTDAEGDPLTVDGVDQPGHGTLWFNRDGSLSYVPDENFNGTDTFTYTVTDGNDSASATVTVTVDAVNDAPQSNDDIVALHDASGVTIDPKDLLSNDTDVDGDTLTVVGVTQPEHGDLWFNRNGSLSYVPDETFRGTDTFTYTVTDGVIGADADGQPVETTSVSVVTIDGRAMV